LESKNPPLPGNQVTHCDARFRFTAKKSHGDMSCLSFVSCYNKQSYGTNESEGFPFIE